MSIPPKMLLDMSGIEVCFLRRSHQRQPRSHICSEGKQTANGAAGDIN